MKNIYIPLLGVLTLINIHASEINIVNLCNNDFEKKVINNNEENLRMEFYEQLINNAKHGDFISMEKLASIFVKKASELISTKQFDEVLYKQYYRKSIYWREKIARNELSYDHLYVEKSCVLLSNYYRNGIFCNEQVVLEKNDTLSSEYGKKAFNSLTHKINMGINVDTLFTLMGLCYEYGIGVEKNLYKVEEYYQKNNSKYPDIPQFQNDLIRIQDKIETYLCEVLSIFLETPDPIDNPPLLVKEAVNNNSYVQNSFQQNLPQTYVSNINNDQKMSGDQPTSSSLDQTENDRTRAPKRSAESDEFTSVKKTNGGLRASLKYTPRDFYLIGMEYERQNEMQKAMQLYAKAAEAKHPESAFRLYELLAGPGKDYSRAFKYLCIAEEAGYKLAQV